MLYLNVDCKENILLQSVQQSKAMELILPEGFIHIAVSIISVIWNKLEQNYKQSQKKFLLMATMRVIVWIHKKAHVTVG